MDDRWTHLERPVGKCSVELLQNLGRNVGQYIDVADGILELLVEGSIQCLHSIISHSVLNISLNRG